MSMISEFVERLVERLEENVEELIGWNQHKVNAYSNAIKIVKQLAAEYNQEPYDPEPKKAIPAGYYEERFNRVM